MKLLRALFLSLLLAAPTLAQTPESPNEHLQIVERVAPRVHVFRHAQPVFAGVIGNVTVIEQEDGLVLVDSGASHGSGRRVVELVRAISSKPVKAVVVTHWHNDHPLGLSAIVDAWPDVDIIAHDSAAADMEAGRLGTVPRAPSAEYEAERLRALREAYANLQSNEVAQAATPEERAGWARALAALDQRLADVAGTHLVLPKRTFSDRLTLPDRRAPVELMFLGRANTSGDISVWLPRQRVLIAGDAVVEPIPYMFNAYPIEMLEVFDRIRALPYRVLVPGHGRLQRDRAYLDRLSALVREVRRQVVPLAEQGVAADQVASRTDFSEQRRLFSGGNPWLAYWFERYSLTPLIDSVYREAQGQVGPPQVAQAGAVPIVPERWALTGEAEIVTHQGRPAIRLGNGRAILRDSDFSTGFIEFDMMVTGERGFAGISFRGQDEGNHEEFYIRPHQSGNPDANQYTPIFNGLAAWQIFTGEGFSAPTRYRTNEWIRVRLDVYPDSALISFDGEPGVHIPDLKRDDRDGFLGFSATFAGAHYSNLRVVPIADHVDPRPAAAPVALPPDIVGQWQVSEALAEEEALRRAAARDWSGVSFAPLRPETHGIANLARVARWSDERPAVIARFTLQARRAGEVPMRFGFSDRAAIFLNGRRLYGGDDSYRSRDYRFLGTVGLYDTLYLPLRAGANEVSFVVTESVGGWAATASVDPATATIVAH
jgi:glyoxylase-like metal-dependent hydrolase (beta-lactamase superfamily II)